ncbi:secondary thiamine-phosphate synthase enzyme [Natronoarchaeum philippinense]|uniref:Secondary thiamine-phosphate synthase enzyme n=1 Tax=Natronoarchaeum philippinense TaxID=558529 RepID=A0A285N698_NATPI|nr:secondary thiamine-phosphate synthase enzyme YjbQ [Natronoarchaeum philippinense]SNZ05004.1 secondary thiamine-phosphate synthase enzyme [Natronoarchaeum philippinense]
MASSTTFSVRTGDRTDTVDVTDRVAAAVPDSTETGVCTVFVRHTTAGICINENESRLRADTEDFLRDLVPDEGHRHDQLDGNADSHLRATLIGASESVPIEDGDLALGRWQSVLLLEFDGPRTREVTVTVVGE